MIGVVLTGALDDGTSGMWNIKRLGGLAICQDLDEAAFPEMPRSLQQYVEVDHTLKLKDIGPLLCRLVAEPASDNGPASEEDLRRLALEVEIATADNAFEKGIMDLGRRLPVQAVTAPW